MAVPVRAELAATLDELAYRMRRCVLRPVTLGRERLEARVQRLPRPEAILAAKAQKLDELSDRLRRGLRDEAGAKREQLGRVAAKLSLPLLRHRVQVSGERIERAGLHPRLLQRRWAMARDSLAPMARVLPQLDPDKPLDRGFARVTARDGRTLTTRDKAAQEAALLLRFRDGTLEVTPGSGGAGSIDPTPPAAAAAVSSGPVEGAIAKRPVRQKPEEPRQGDLF